MILMKNIIIVTPLQKEFDNLRDSLVALGLDSREGKIGKLDVLRFPTLNITLARGGHGKTQFGIQTQYLLDHAQFDLVICAGAAGALAPKVKVGDLIVATKTVEHDYNTKFTPHPRPRFVGDSESIKQLKILKMSDLDFKVHFGVMAGGDEDVIDVERGKELHKRHKALAVAWEGVGGARACTFSEVPYIELRGATDTANHEAPVVFYVNLKIVMRNIASLIYRWLSNQKPKMLY